MILLVCFWQLAGFISEEIFENIAGLDFLR